MISPLKPLSIVIFCEATIMAEPIHSPEAKPVSNQPEELGLFDTYGTFPVWMLKAIEAITPDFLTTQPTTKTESQPKAE